MITQLARKCLYLFSDTGEVMSIYVISLLRLIRVNLQQAGSLGKMSERSENFGIRNEEFSP